MVRPVHAASATFQFPVNSAMTFSLWVYFQAHKQMIPSCNAAGCCRSCCCYYTPLSHGTEQHRRQPLDTPGKSLLIAAFDTNKLHAKSCRCHWLISLHPFTWRLEEGGEDVGRVGVGMTTGLAGKLCYLFSGPDRFVRSPGHTGQTSGGPVCCVGLSR